MSRMKIYRFFVEGHNGQLAGIDVISSKSPAEALLMLGSVLPDGFHPYSVFNWYEVHV